MLSFMLESKELLEYQERRENILPVVNGGRKQENPYEIFSFGTCLTTA